MHKHLLTLRRGMTVLCAPSKPRHPSTPTAQAPQPPSPQLILLDLVPERLMNSLREIVACSGGTMTRFPFNIMCSCDEDAGGGAILRDNCMLSAQLSVLCLPLNPSLHHSFCVIIASHCARPFSSTQFTPCTRTVYQPPLCYTQGQRLVARGCSVR